MTITNNKQVIIVHILTLFLHLSTVGRKMMQVRNDVAPKKQTNIVETIKHNLGNTERQKFDTASTDSAMVFKNTQIANSIESSTIWSSVAADLRFKRAKVNAASSIANL